MPAVLRSRFQKSEVLVEDVVDHPLDREAVKVAPAHLDDRAETAVEGAAARRLDDVDLPTHHRVPRQHAGGAVGRTDLPGVEVGHSALRCGSEGLPIAEPETGDARQWLPTLEGTDQLPEGQIPLAPDDRVDANVGIRPRFRRQAGIVPADHDADLWRE